MLLGTRKSRKKRAQLANASSYTLPLVKLLQSPRRTGAPCQLNEDACSTFGRRALLKVNRSNYSEMLTVSERFQHPAPRVALLHARFLASTAVNIGIRTIFAFDQQPALRFDR